MSETEKLEQILNEAIFLHHSVQWQIHVLTTSGDVDIWILTHLRYFLWNQSRLWILINVLRDFAWFQLFYCLQTWKINVKLSQSDVQPVSYMKCVSHRAAMSTPSAHRQTLYPDLLIFRWTERRKIGHSLRRPAKGEEIILSLDWGQCTHTVDSFWLSVALVSQKNGTETPVHTQADLQSVKLVGLTCAVGSFTAVVSG